MKLTNSAGRSAGPDPRTTLPAPPAAMRAEDGFSLVEVIVAMMVLVWSVCSAWPRSSISG